MQYFFLYYSKSFHHVFSNFTYPLTSSLLSCTNIIWRVYPYWIYSINTYSHKVSPNIYTPTCYDYMNMYSIKRLTMKIKLKCTLYLFTPISLQRSELSFPLMRTVSHFSSFLCFDFFCCVIWTLNDVSFYGENDFSISEICS